MSTPNSNDVLAALDTLLAWGLKALAVAALIKYLAA